MYLKRLDILGFKTFAEKTELLFTPGITAVVGPNGSGKSNIADAILWVLGEGNVRSLRGQTSQDVIFAGNERRKPLGMAEVSLTIDNSARILPIEFSEVTVTRRVYRSGEGECFINRVACRLRDIVELFMDTGLSRDAYSLVSQSEIDAILSVRSEDRRAIFEEAAGIKKYRHRKREAVRKLESTRQNLVRIQDIVAELEAQLGPLARQATVARRYQELSSRLYELELAWLGSQLRRLSGEKERLAGLVEQIRAERDRVDAVALAIRAEESQLQEAEASREAALEAARVRETEARAGLADAEKRLSLLSERRTAGERRQEELTRELRDLAERISASQRRAEAAEAERGELLVRLGELKRQVGERAADLRVASEALESEQRALEAERGRMLELARRQSAARNQLAALDRQSQSLAEAEVRLEEEHAAAEAEVSRLAEQLRATQEQLLQLAAARAEDERMLETLRAEAGAAQAARDAALKAAREAEAAWRAAAARHAALAEMRDSHQGYEEGVRALMKAAREGRIRGDFRLLSDALHVPEGLEAAVEAALGPLAQAIVTPTAAEALAAAAFARAQRAGRVALLPLELLEGRGGERASGREGEGASGEILADLVASDPSLAAAVAGLLGSTVLVSDLDSAVQALASPLPFRIAFARHPAPGTRHGSAATRDGDLLTAQGALFAGQAADGKSRARSLLARRRELEELERQAGTLEAAHQEAREEAERRAAACERLREEREERSRLLEKRRAEHAGASRERERLAADGERARRQVERLARQIEATREEQERAREERSRVAAQLSGSDAQAVELEAAISRRQAELAERAAAHRRRESEIADARVEIAGIEERARAAADAARRAIDGRTQAQRQLEARAGEQVTLESDLALWEEQRAEAERARDEHARSLATIEQEQSGLREGISALRAQLQAVARRLATEGDRRGELVERAHRAEVEQTAAESEWSHLVAHLREEYDLAPEQTPAAGEALSQVADPAAEVARLRRQIKALGAVNPEAVEEHARLSERHDFLAAQRADLETAQEQLQQAIREIDATTRETFLVAFQQIGEAFDEMFRRLFGGGRTELILTDPADVLETGIEIIVQPPGKRLQNLLLLSGGERALTAAAMLFALMRVRPSPFCVLDEVDAPLDEANVGRFSDLLREFARRSQFIVVTHNRGTMEAADTLYGVTMEEPGVSRIVSVRLSDVADDETALGNGERRHPLAGNRAREPVAG